MSPASVIDLHPLVIRPDDDGWLVGRAASGTFVQLPTEAVTLIGQVRAGRCVGDAEAAVYRRHGVAVDGIRFVEELVELGFVARLDGYVYADEVVRPNLAWLRREHLRWLVHPAFGVAVLAFLASGLAAGVTSGTLDIRFDAYFVSNWQGVNLAVNVAMFAAAVAGHELAHLLLARAAGVTGRIGLGTRLQFLVAQTTVSGLWAHPRPVRLRVYAAGTVFDLVLVAGCQWALAAGVGGFAGRCLDALSVGLLVGVLLQFALYMRTDVYFVVQDLLRCKNLHADASAYARYRWARLRDRFELVADPAEALPARERTPVRVYAAVMVAGSMVSMAMFCAYSLPLLVTTLMRAAGEVSDGLRGGHWLRAGDGLLVIGIQAALKIIFVRVFVARRRPLPSGGAVSAPRAR